MLENFSFRSNILDSYWFTYLQEKTVKTKFETKSEASTGHSGQDSAFEIGFYKKFKSSSGAIFRWCMNLIWSSSIRREKKFLITFFIQSTSTFAAHVLRLEL